jgi:hypothetical protein
MNNEQLNDLAEDFYELTQGLDREALTKKVVGKSPDELFQLIAKASAFDSEVKFRNILKKSKFKIDDILSALFEISEDVEALINKNSPGIKASSSNKKEKSSNVWNASDVSINPLFKNVDKSFKPESEKEIFNKYAFADQDRIGKKPPYEESSAIEYDVFQDLENHIIDNISLDIRTTDILSSLLAQKKYPDVIKEYQGTIYRGMGVNKNFFEAVGIQNFSLKKGVIIQASFIYKPKKGNSSSWSESKTKAESFAKENLGPLSWAHNKIGILLVAEQKNNVNKLLRCTNALYNFSNFDAYKGEKEVIGLGDIKVNKIIIIGASE